MGKNKNSTLNQQSKERQPIDQVRSILNGDPQLKEQINSILNGELSTMIDGVSYSTEQDLIGYLKTISDYDKLVNIREDTFSDSKPRELVENRMSEVIDNEMVIIDKECFKSILNNLSKKYIIINDKITNSWKKYLSKVSTK